MLDVYNGVKDDDHQSEAHSSGGSASSNSARRYRSCTTMRQQPSHATTTTAVATASTTTTAAATAAAATATAASTSKYSSVHMSQCSVVVRDLRQVAPLRVTSRQHISPRQWERLKQEQPDNSLSLMTRIKQEKHH